MRTGLAGFDYFLAIGALRRVVAYVSGRRPEDLAHLEIVPGGSS